MRKALIAFGGNALIRADELGIQKQQLENAREAAEMVVALLEQGWLPLLVHGNGPQVGNVLIQQEEAANKVPPYTMDICGAQTQGSMGYMLQRCLENMLRLKKMEYRVASILTEVVVDREDDGFRRPTKPVGPFYEAFRAHELFTERGWTMKEDSGRGWRRIVPSPIPQEIVQIDAIRHLTDSNFIVLSCGGGGIPVVKDRFGYFMGVEAVVDKDRTAAMLGRELQAETFIILTGVDKVSINFGKPDQQDLDEITISQARRYLKEGQFPAGSMGPKIEAAIGYIEGGGEQVVITTVDALLRGSLDSVGTRIIPD